MLLLLIVMLMITGLLADSPDYDDDACYASKV